MWREGRNNKMATQRDPNRQAVMSHIPLETAAKIKTYIKGRTVKCKAKKGMRIRKQERDMTMSDYIIEKAENGVRNVKMDDESRKWMEERLRKNMKLRKAQDKIVREEAKAREKAKQTEQ